MPQKRGAGRYRHRVTLQSATDTGPTIATHGAVTQTWSTYAAVWALVTPLSARERMDMAQVVPEATHSVAMRHNIDVAAGHRLLFNHRVLTVAAPPINVDEAGRETVLTCIEEST